MTADTVGGVWTYAVELTRELTRRGHTVALATMGAPLAAGQRQEAEAANVWRVFESRYRLEWMEEPWNDVQQAGKWLLEIERTYRPDVVHLNSFAHGVLNWSAPLLVVGHSCVCSWWRAVRGTEAPESWDQYRALVGRGLRAARLVVAPTASMLHSLAQDYGPFQASTVISNGIEAGAYQRQAKESYILAAGRLWDEAKNLAALESVAAGVRWPVYVAGNLEHPSGRMVRTRHVSLLGQLSRTDLMNWFARAAIYVLPARYEPFGLSVLEAAAHGCAPILGDIPSLRENWCGAARFVPPDDHGALLTNIDVLTCYENLRQALSESARQRAREFTSTRMAESYIAAYQNLIQPCNI